MHATVVRVSISDSDASEKRLKEEIVPTVKQAPGFVAGYWTREGDNGLSMVVFESEDAARAAADRIPQMLPEGVTLESLEVRTVVASA
jgi:hypothetical protein